VAQLLHELVGRLGRLLPGLSYNWLLHTAPLNHDAHAHHHWRIEIIPRLTRTAAYEWSTGNAINAMPPEHAATALRSGDF
jgi:UDPglucose--hexose-1-phosphate uridylyltransferase